MVNLLCTSMDCISKLWKPWNVMTFKKLSKSNHFNLNELLERGAPMASDGQKGWRLLFNNGRNTSNIEEQYVPSFGQNQNIIEACACRPRSHLGVGAGCILHFNHRFRFTEVDNIRFCRPLLYTNFTFLNIATSFLRFHFPSLSMFWQRCARVLLGKSC